MNGVEFFLCIIHSEYEYFRSKLVLVVVSGKCWKQATVEINAIVSKSINALTTVNLSHFILNYAKI